MNFSDQPSASQSAGTRTARPWRTLRNWSIHVAVFAVVNLIMAAFGASWIAGVLGGTYEFSSVLSTVEGPWLVNGSRIWFIVLVVDTLYSIAKTGMNLSAASQTR